MIKEITIVSGTGESVVIGNDPSKDYEFVLDSIDWDTPAVTMSTYRIPNQIGESFQGVVVGTRKPTVTGYVVANTKNIDTNGLTWAEYYDKQLEKIEENKEKLNRVISIMVDSEIFVNEYVLECRPYLPPKYANDESRNNEVVCYFELSFECFNPLFMSKNYEEFEMTDSMSDYEVNNDGQSKVGMEVTMTFSGTVEKPTFTNKSSGESITVEKTFNANDTIKITTEVGNENLYTDIGSDGVGLQSIHLVSVDSEFPKLDVGRNSLAFSAINGSSNISVSVRYKKQFYVLKGM